VGVGYTSRAVATIDTIQILGGTFELDCIVAQSGTGIGAGSSENSGTINTSTLLLGGSTFRFGVGARGIGCGSGTSLGNAAIEALVLDGGDIQVRSGVAGIGVGRGNCSIGEVVLRSGTLNITSPVGIGCGDDGKVSRIRCEGGGSSLRLMCHSDVCIKAQSVVGGPVHINAIVSGPRFVDSGELIEDAELLELFVQYETVPTAKEGLGLLPFLEFVDPDFGYVNDTEVAVGFHRVGSLDDWDREVNIDSQSTIAFVVSLPVAGDYEVHFGPLGEAKHRVLCDGPNKSFPAFERGLMRSSVGNCDPPPTVSRSPTESQTPTPSLSPSDRKSVV
jgi:hypothetical protein